MQDSMDDESDAVGVDNTESVSKSYTDAWP